MKKKSSAKNDFLEFDSFQNLSNILKPLKAPSFKKANESFQNIEISSLLLSEINKSKTPCFLLPAVIEFIDEVNQIIAPSDYTFSHFEFWLNQFSGLSDEENYLVRAKISGKHVPRDQYQIFFPIGSGKRFPGSHYVTAHGSPDLDTTIASFWGWVDAFAARVSDGLHIWNVPPGGVLSTLDAAPLTDVFKKTLFKHLSQNRSSLSPMGIDFTTQKTLLKKNLEDSSIDLGDYERHKHAVMVVDPQGFYIGDLRSEDYESIRQVIRLVTNNLKWFENTLQTQFINLFCKKSVTLSCVKEVLNTLFNQEIIECVNTRQLTEKLKTQVDHYLKHILELRKGIEASFRELGLALKKLKIQKLSQLEKKLEAAFTKNNVFSANGKLTEKRESIFKAFNEISVGIDEAVDEMRIFMESMDVAIKIKRKVFNFPARYVTPEAALDEILDKIGVFSHLSVVYPNKNGGFWPLGIIRAESVRSKSLGTVTLRDFCNRSEVNIDSNLEIISVIDHHKTDLKTSSPPIAVTGDVQSCNILVAELAFSINDLYNTGSLTKKQIESELKALSLKPLTNSMIRIKNRLLQKCLATSKPSKFFIDPKREYFEYLSFLHAIIDDTDLLSKATKRDVLCIASLLNRMKSLKEKKEIEIIEFDHIAEDEHFVENAVTEIVQNKEMYTIYKGIYSAREKNVESAILNTASGKSMEIFSDTKEQNGCCRVGQTKFFTHNIKSIENNFEKLISFWLEKSQEIHSNHSSIDLYIHMMSTIPSADDVYKGGDYQYKHKDAIWIWIPNTNQAVHHLTGFLNAFRNLPILQTNNMQYQVLDNEDVDYQSIIKHHFMNVLETDKIKIKKKMPLVILSFDAGTLNSRKAQITPCLPVLVK